MQTTNTVMMVRPSNFGYNEETAQNNAFQTNDDSLSAAQITQQAIQEFDGLVELLRQNGISVMIVEDDPSPIKPDAVFPNNWISFHDDGALITYPMFSPKRRAERSGDIVAQIKSKFVISQEYSFAHYEEKDQFLEGTGSMLLDRENQIVYACLSPRTDIRVLDKFCVLRGYDKSIFYAKDAQGEDIYHTNVMMALGTDIAVISLETIVDDHECKAVVDRLIATNKTIVDITLAQVNQFAGNMLELRNNLGKKIMVMSQCAYDSLDSNQIKQIEASCKILSYPIPTIEKYGGGSVRCMIAEIFSPPIPMNM